jgi:hypothetical protein
MAQLQEWESAMGDWVIGDRNRPSSDCHIADSEVRYRRSPDRDIGE